MYRTDVPVLQYNVKEEEWFEIGPSSGKIQECDIFYCTIGTVSCSFLAFIFGDVNCPT